MCGGSREAHDIEEAEKMELEEQKNKSISTNVQISMVVRMAEESEPDLFGRGTAKLWRSSAHALTEIQQELYDKMLLTAKWHGALQAKFWREFEAEKLAL